jgi:glycosyltransferase involved in cell wall biosynthesis
MAFIDHSDEMNQFRRRTRILEDEIARLHVELAEARERPLPSVAGNFTGEGEPAGDSEIQRLKQEVENLRDLADRLRKDPFEWLVQSSVSPSGSLRFRNKMVRGMVSVIIPGYKGRNYLQRCFESVWAQEPGPFSLEIVFCDDGCPEQTRVFAAELAQRSDVPVTIVEHPGSANRGVGPARNLAMAHSSGEFLALLDADDEWLPSKCRIQIKYLLEHPEAEVVCGYAHCVDLQNNPVIGWGGGKLAGYFGSDVAAHTFEALLDSDPIVNSTVMMRRTAVERCGGYTEVMAHQAEDWLLFQKLSLKAPIYVIPLPVGLYRVHSSSYTATYVKQGYDPAVRWETHLQLLHWLLQDARSREVARKVYRLYTPKLLVEYGAKFRALENTLNRKTAPSLPSVVKEAATRPTALQRASAWLERQWTQANSAVLPRGGLE